MTKFHLGEEITAREVDDLRLEVTAHMLPVKGDIRQIQIQVFLKSRQEPLLTVVTYD